MPFLIVIALVGRAVAGTEQNENENIPIYAAFLIVGMAVLWLVSGDEKSAVVARLWLKKWWEGRDQSRISGASNEIQRIVAAPEPQRALQAMIKARGGGAYLGVNDVQKIVAADSERAVLVLGPPRSGKTSAVIVPTVICAVGPVGSTSTKLDVYKVTMSARRQFGERVWVFDPAGYEQTPEAAEQLRWSPIISSRSWDGALRMARAMVTARPPRGEVSGTDLHFMQLAGDLLAVLLYAAALSEGSILDVRRWVLRRGIQEPGKILTEAANPDALSSVDAAPSVDAAQDILDGIAQTADREHSSIYTTAANALAAYNSDGARATASHPNFDPDAFVRSHETIYITAPADYQALTAPLVVGLLSDIRQATYARNRTESSYEPVTFALDELRNIAPIHDLPSIVSEAGGQGLHLIACFQDLSQVRERWGIETAEGFLTLFQTKVIFPGILDQRTIEALSRAFGEYDREIMSYGSSTMGKGAGRSQSYSTQREPVLSPGDIAAIPQGRVLFTQGARWQTLRETRYFRDEPWLTLLSQRCSKCGARSRVPGAARFCPQCRADLSGQGSSV